MRRIVIPDVHGCVLTLIFLLDVVLKVTKEDIVIFLGDFIDRGKNSKAVIDELIRRKQEGFQITGVLGNHDDWMLTAYRDDNADVLSAWLTPNAGGCQTLISYGVSPEVVKGNYGGYFYFADLTLIPQPHIDFLEEFPEILVLDDFVFVHGALDMTQEDPLRETSPRIAMWERACGIFDHAKIGGRTLISGHTPYSLEEIKTMVTTRAPHIFLDNGCVFAGKEGLGNLVALDLDSMELFIQPNID